MYGIRLVLLFTVLCEVLSSPSYRPVVLMHGILAGSDAMSDVQTWIEADFPGIYVHNMEIGNGKDDSLHMNMNQQVELFAQGVQNDTKLAGGFNIIAHSQGGLITRAYVERYNNPPVYNLISWAGPQDGVYGVPEINSICSDAYCPELDWLFNTLMDLGSPSAFLQEHYSFAAYWKDIFNYGDYLKNNIFLADINNERPSTNATYNKHIISLNTYVLIYSTNDTVVVPKQSPWFYFYPNNSDTTIVPFNQSLQYTEDLIGLRTLDEQGKLAFYHIPCPHPVIPNPGCGETYYDKYTRQYLNNTL